MFSYSLTIAIACRLMRKSDKKKWGMEMLEIFAYRTVAAVRFTDQNWVPKTVYCIRCVMVCKIGFTNWNAKIARLRAPMVVTYYIKLLRTGVDRHKGILMSSRRDNYLTCTFFEIINYKVIKGDQFAKAAIQSCS